jgi:hypothetical protein
MVNFYTVYIKDGSVYLATIRDTIRQIRAKIFEKYIIVSYCDFVSHFPRILNINRIHIFPCVVSETLVDERSFGVVERWNELVSFYVHCPVRI